jgi:hypothetical protein
MKINVETKFNVYDRVYAHAPAVFKEVKCRTCKCTRFLPTARRMARYLVWEVRTSAHGGENGTTPLVFYVLRRSSRSDSRILSESDVFGTRKEARASKPRD